MSSLPQILPGVDFGTTLETPSAAAPTTATASLVAGGNNGNALGGLGDFFGSLLTSPLANTLAGNLTAPKPAKPAAVKPPTALPAPANTGLGAQLAAMPLYGKIALGVAAVAAVVVVVRLAGRK